MPAEPGMGAVIPLGLKAALDRIAEEIDRSFDLLLPIPPDPRRNLYEAMRHAAIGGGKRS